MLAIVALADLYAVVLLLNSTTVGTLGEAVVTVPTPTTLLAPSTLNKFVMKFLEKTPHLRPCLKKVLKNFPYDFNKRKVKTLIINYNFDIKFN